MRYDQRILDHMSHAKWQTPQEIVGKIGESEDKKYADFGLLYKKVLETVRDMAQRGYADRRQRENRRAFEYILTPAGVGIKNECIEPASGLEAIVQPARV